MVVTKSQVERLLRGEPLSGNEIMQHLFGFERYAPDDIEYAKSLTQADVRYLRPHQIDWVIEASLSNQAALKIAESNKVIAQRMGNILPDILFLIGKKNEGTVSYVINRLFDIADDFIKPPADARRVDKVRNDKLRLLAKSATALEGAAKALTQLDSEVWEYGSELRTFLDATTVSSTPWSHSEAGQKDPVEDLLRRLEAAAVAIKTLSYDFRSEFPRSPPKSFSMSKGDIVALTYDIYYQCDGPPLKTTPGSNFSFLSSLLYEAATGHKEESLMGAVIEFARSDVRKAEDAFQVEESRDEEAYRADDNFHHQRIGKAEDEKSAAWYRNALTAFLPEDPAHSAIARVVESLDASAANREFEVGPFIVWADHMPDWRNGTISQEFREVTEDLRTSRRRLGDARRAAAAKGLGDLE